MRLAKVIIFIALLSASATAAQEAVPTTGLNLRSEPVQRRGNILKVLGPSEQLEILEAQGGWYRVRIFPSGETGWVAKRFVRVVPANSVSAESKGDLIIGMLVAIFAAGLGAAGYLIKRRIERGDVIKVKVSGGSSLSVAVKEPLLAASPSLRLEQAKDITPYSFSYEPPPPPPPSYSPPAPAVYAVSLPSDGREASTLLNWFAKEAIASQVDDFAAFQPPSSPFSISSNQSESGLVTFKESNLDLELGNALLFQNGSLEFDAGTLLYGNKERSIAFLAKYDPEQAEHVELIDNDKEFMFRIEKK